MKRHTVIITGADTPTGLTTARALQKLPVRRIGVTARPGAPACHSRVWDELVQTEADAHEQLATLRALAESRNFQEKPVLLFSQDDLVQAASTHRTDLQAFFHLPLPDADATDRMLDKTAFQAWAEERGYAVPPSLIVSDREHLEQALSEMPRPAILKPLVRTPAWDSVMPNQKVLWLRDDKDCRDVLSREDLFQLCPRFLVQSWVEGGDDAVYFCLFAMNAHGAVLDQVAGRKYLQWPPLTGSTAICQAIHDPDLLDLSRTILQEAGLKGLGSIEYKKSAQDGKYYITEPTVGRNDHQSAVALAAGHNPTAALVAHCLGLPPPETASIGTAPSPLWIDELGTLRHCRQEGNALRMLKLVAKSCRHGLPRPLLFRFTDPKPFGYAAGSLFQRRGGSHKPVDDTPPQTSTDRNRLRIERLTEERFLALQDEWSDLVDRSCANPLFMGWEWLSAWWETWSKPLGLELVLIAAYSGDRLVGIAPLYRRRRRLRLGPSVEELHLLGNAPRIAPTVRTEYVDLIIDRDYQDEVVKALTSHLREMHWDLLAVCDHVTLPDSPLGALLKGLALHQGPGQQESGIHIDTAGEFETWLDGLGANTRLKAFNRRRYLRQKGTPAHVIAENDGEHALDILNAFHLERWGKPCFEGASLEFHRRFLKRLSGRILPLFTRLEIEGRTVSILYDVKVADCIYNIQAGFDEQFDNKVSLGTLHLGYAIEHAFAQHDVRRYDLLAGSGKRTFYKARLNGTEVVFGTSQHLRARWIRHAWKAQAWAPRAATRAAVKWLERA